MELKDKIICCYTKEEYLECLRILYEASVKFYDHPTIDDAVKALHHCDGTGLILPCAQDKYLLQSSISWLRCNSPYSTREFVEAKDFLNEMQGGLAAADALLLIS